MSSVSATASSSSLRTEPVIEQAKLDVDAGDRPLSYGIAVYAAERIRFVVRRDGTMDGAMEGD